MEKQIKTIGVLTSGGDAPGMNAAVRAVVRTGLHKGFRMIGIQRGYNGLLNGECFEMNLRSVSNIISAGGTILYTARCLEFKTKEGQDKGAAKCRELGIDALVVIGGDGSYRGARELAHRGIPMIGLPGTIDNDIACTDYTIGYDTAMNTALEMIDKIGADQNVSAVSVTADDCKIDAIKESLEKGDIISAGTYDNADLKELVKNKCKLAIVPSDILTAKAENTGDDSTEDTADAEQTDDVQSDENQIAAKYPEMTAFAEKLAILKIPMILDRSKDEKDVLAKYEWSKVYGALFGCEKEASKLYEAAVSGHSGDNSESSDTSESTDTTENTDTEQ